MAYNRHEYEKTKNRLTTFLTNEDHADWVRLKGMTGERDAVILRRIVKEYIDKKTKNECTI